LKPINKILYILGIGILIFVIVDVKTELMDSHIIPILIGIILIVLAKFKKPTKGADSLGG